MKKVLASSVVVLMVLFLSAGFLVWRGETAAWRWRRWWRWWRWWIWSCAP